MGLHKTATLTSTLEASLKPATQSPYYKTPNDASRIGSPFWKPRAVLGGSWDLVSTVLSTQSGVISNLLNYKYSYLNYNPSY